jgi:serine/threonine-protein kinase RsbW
MLSEVKQEHVSPDPKDLIDRIRAQITSHPRNAGVARDLVGSVARRFNYSKEVVSDLRILAGEAVSNIIQHAYSDRTDLPILIDIRIFTQYMELQFRDFGLKINPKELVKKDLKDYRTNGLGIYLISRLSDFHVFSSDGDSGNRLIIKKRTV